MKDYSNFYGSNDPRDVPHYGVTEAVSIIPGIPKSTLRNWFNGENPTLAPSDVKPLTLSFNNIVEASILRTLRVNGVQLKAVREAIAYAESQLQINHLLLHEGLRTDGVDLMLEQYGKTLSLSPSAQLYMAEMLSEHLLRIDYTDSFADKIYPIVGNNPHGKDICVDPLVSFGRATVSEKRISTQIIHQRFNKGESVNELEADYGLEKQQVVSAIVFEEAA